MLAADDVAVSLVGSQIVLTLDPAGTAITDLHTTYNAASNQLTITAASAGTLTTQGATPGIPTDLVTESPEGRPLRLIDGKPIKEWL